MALDFLPPLLAAFFTILITVFIAELTDKDALLLLALATKINPWIVFASGATAFTITTTIIVSVGYILIQVVPVWIIKLAGGAIMIGYAVWGYFRERAEEKKAVEEEEKVLKHTSNGKTASSIFFGAIAMLIVLDLAGDATEVLTIVYVARFENVLLVFIACVIALVLASALETVLGNRLGKLLSIDKIRLVSLGIFLVIGSIVIVTTLFPNWLPQIA
ncbi:MAG: TMEM165/GDT1 family protein [Nitrososphaerales archaeon]